METSKAFSDIQINNLRQCLCGAGEQMEITDPMVNTISDNNVYILKKPAVTDPIEQFAKIFFQNNDIECTRFQEGIFIEDKNSVNGVELKRLFNPIIEDVYNDLNEYLSKFQSRAHKDIKLEFNSLKPDELLRVSRSFQLSLNLKELIVIQEYFRRIKREPTTCELETIAQTWSEHCKHKTITSPVEFNGEIINGLLQETIMKITKQLKKDFCLSVFKDNAGIVKYTNDYAVCAKVETHNHPSAIEPFGGANTGVGGVIRDILGCGLVSKPAASVDVFAVGFPHKNYEDAPINSRELLKELVKGVGDYGNKIGIPTVAGAVIFHDDYRYNPLVYCGTIGIIPVDKINKRVEDGDLIILIGGKTGRDGLHGATFSSMEVTPSTEEEFSASVQIGNPIEEKKMMDALLLAAERDLINSVTDCGAGGLSSAIGEMGETVGAEVHLEQIPLKYTGLLPKEIWLSESQERMILAISKNKYEQFEKIMNDYDVESTVVGQYAGTGRLKVFFDDQIICDLDMEFLHNGLPRDVLCATWSSKSKTTQIIPLKDKSNYADELFRMCEYEDVSSKEWIIRQYDQEVFGRTVGKPLLGKYRDAPSNGAVILLPDGKTSVAIGLGVAHRFSRVDPYQAAANSIDEAVRNVLALGADPAHISLLDNFCWPSVAESDDLGALVLACRACYDVAKIYETPFISGKDSLNNEFIQNDGKKVKIPYTLLITALGRIEDLKYVRSSDFKRSKNSIYLLGLTDKSIRGSVYDCIYNVNTGDIPRVDPALLVVSYRKLHEAIKSGLIESVHDISDGGLSISVVESCFGGDCGAYIDLVSIPSMNPMKDYELLFSEAPGRFILEVSLSNEQRLEKLFQGVPLSKIGYVKSEKTIIFKGLSSYTEVNQADLKRRWKHQLQLDV
ncbi:MAG: phosphoribosylformylglycinamidine synthase subunit PurL [Planctomycetes bacterium]|nr:phosphoribosylformylglycinamidine synthase subunit PurL [Planctomycetota bacterium]